MFWIQDDNETLAGIETASEEGAAFSIRFKGLEVGRLIREDGFWVFRYSDEFKKQSKYSPITDFPSTSREYRSRSLWPFFVIRIPSLAQPDVQQFMAKRGLAKIDQTTLLRKFGRRSVADPYELVPA